jgi:hypothetical protein
MKKKVTIEKISRAGGTVMKDLISKIKPENLPQRLVGIMVALIIVFVTAMGLGVYFNKRTAEALYNNYMENTREIIDSRSQIETANSWERLSVNERKEKLRSRFYEIIKYYTVTSPLSQKMSDEQLLLAFNTYYDAIYTVNSVNFFLPLAYIRVKTNYNPSYSDNYQTGISGFFTVEGQQIANLPIVKENQALRVAYKGKETLQNPTESLRLLIARMDDLMRTFNNREDWVILALLNHDENQIIAKYWEDGKGEIPETNYKSGDMKNILEYYYAFKNWQIVATTSK